MQDRTINLCRVRAGDLVPHPLAWRLHPEHQRNSLREMMGRLGWLIPVVARRDASGALVLIKGHARVGLVDADEHIPVVVVDVDEIEVVEAMVTLDALGGMTIGEPDALEKLLKKLNDRPPFDSELAQEVKHSLDRWNFDIKDANECDAAEQDAWRTPAHYVTDDDLPACGGDFRVLSGGHTLTNVVKKVTCYACRDTPLFSAAKNLKHFQTEPGRSACGSIQIPRPLTEDPEAVTCNRCRRHAAYLGATKETQ